MRSATGAWCCRVPRDAAARCPQLLAGMQRARHTQADRRSSRRPLELPVIGARARAEPHGLARQPERRIVAAPDDAGRRVRAQEHDVDPAHLDGLRCDDWRAGRAGACRPDLRQLATRCRPGPRSVAGAQPARRLLGPARHAAARSRAACIQPWRVRCRSAPRDVATPESRFDLRSSCCLTCCCCSHSSAACSSPSTRRRASASGSRSSRCSRHPRRAAR